MYKTVSKLLANRLKTVLPFISSKMQSAFVKDRFILDGPLILSERSWAKKTKKDIFVFKIDFERAYDFVSWVYLLHNLKLMGFPEGWRNWIYACLSTGRVSMLVNGSPTELFDLKSGLRQGDPLSPFLFVIVLEILDIFMSKAIKEGLFEGVQLPDNGPAISHFCYADDVIFVGKRSEENFLNLNGILRFLNLVSGLKVNLSKSSSIGVGTNSKMVKTLADKIHCNVGTLPMEYLVGTLPMGYLGLPIGCNMKIRKPWLNLLSRISNKLSLWKAKFLSMAGQITLAKSVLGNLPIYFLSLFKAPDNVLKSIDTIRLCVISREEAFPRPRGRRDRSRTP